jgi:hypothetical protein
VLPHRVQVRQRDGRQIYSLVLRQAGLIAMIGDVAGLILAAYGSRVIEAQLWGVTACEATRVEPVEVLKIE